MKQLQFKLPKTGDTASRRAWCTEQKQEESFNFERKDKLVHEVALNTVLYRSACNMM